MLICAVPECRVPRSGSELDDRVIPLLDGSSVLGRAVLMDSGRNEPDGWLPGGCEADVTVDRFVGIGLVCCVVENPVLTLDVELVLLSIVVLPNDFD